MWAVVHMIDGLEKAQALMDQLQTEGFLVKIKPFAKEGETTIYQILTPQFEVEEVQNAIYNLDF